VGFSERYHQSIFQDFAVSSAFPQPIARDRLAFMNCSATNFHPKDFTSPLSCHIPPDKASHPLYFFFGRGPIYNRPSTCEGFLPPLLQTRHQPLHIQLAETSRRGFTVLPSDRPFIGISSLFLFGFCFFAGSTAPPSCPVICPLSLLFPRPLPLFLFHSFLPPDTSLHYQNSGIQIPPSLLNSPRLSKLPSSPSTLLLP